MCFRHVEIVNEIANKFLLTGEKLMPEMHLRQPGFIYSSCKPSTKTIQKFTETGNSFYNYQNALDSACFQ